MNATARDAYEDAMVDTRHQLIKDLDRRIAQLLQEVEPLLGKEMEMAAWSDTMMGLVEGLHRIWREGLRRGMLQFGDTSLWPLWLEITPKPLIEEIDELADKVDPIFAEVTERERAWLIMALNEGTLSQYLEVLGSNQSILHEHYEETAFLCNEQNRQLLKEQLARLDTILFNLSLLEYAAWAKELRERSALHPTPPSLEPLPELPVGSPEPVPSLAEGEVITVEEVPVELLREDSSALREFAEMASGVKKPIITQRLSPARESSASDTTRYRESNSDSNVMKEGDVFTAFEFIPNAVQALGRRVSEVIRGHAPVRRSADVDSVGSFETIDRGMEEARLMVQSKSLRLELGPVTSLKDQQFKCHECDAAIGVGAAAEARLCHLSGHYFCPQCQLKEGRSLSAALIILNWDFDPVPASTRAIQCFNAQATTELVDLETINPLLFERVPELPQIRHLRQQIKLVHEFVRPCRSGLLEVVRKTLWPRTHLLKSDRLYCLTDLVEISSGELKSLLEDTLHELTEHAQDACSQCRSRAVFCQYCQGEQALFPFSLGVKACSRCEILSHEECYQAGSCPNCDRLLNERLAMAGL